MEEDQFLELVFKHFGYLIDGFNLVLVYRYGDHGFYHRGLTFASEHFGVDFISDRADIGIKVASVDEVHCGVPVTCASWYDLDLVIGLLTPGATADDLVRFYIEVGWNMSDYERVDRQLAHWAHATRPYWEQVVSVCQSGEVNGHQSALKVLALQRHDAFVRQIEERHKRED